MRVSSAISDVSEFVEDRHAITGTRWNGPRCSDCALKKPKRAWRPSLAIALTREWAMKRARPERRAGEADKLRRCVIPTCARRLITDLSRISIHSTRNARLAQPISRVQASEGWTLVRDHYDDGGFSGGSLATSSPAAASRRRPTE